MLKRWVIPLALAAAGLGGARGAAGEPVLPLPVL